MECRQTKNVYRIIDKTGIYSEKYFMTNKW